jgi:hypothetical protein
VRSKLTKWQPVQRASIAGRRRFDARQSASIAAIERAPVERTGRRRDELIWQLSGIDPELGACITAQLSTAPIRSTTNRITVPVGAARHRGGIAGLAADRATANGAAASATAFDIDRSGQARWTGGEPPASVSGDGSRC